MRCSDGPTDDQVDDDQRSNVTYLGQLGVGGPDDLMAATAAVHIAVGRVAGRGRGHVGDGMDLDERMEGPGGKEEGGRWEVDGSGPVPRDRRCLVAARGNACRKRRSRMLPHCGCTGASSSAPGAVMVSVLGSQPGRSYRGHGRKRNTPDKSNSARDRSELPEEGSAVSSKNRTVPWCW